jgi:hypothetical protein
MTTPLEFDFIKKGDLDALTAALDGGTDPNATDAGGFWNELHMVNLLLSRGANVHQKTLNGWTALHSAARGNKVIPAVFSAAGPRAMNFPNCYGCTPLH